jgi:polyhydroxyalkanoate synthesis regulator phasin
MKKQILTLGALALISGGLLTSTTFAHGMGGGRGGMGGGLMGGTPAEQSQNFQRHIDTMVAIFGITQDQAKAYWAEDKDIKDIATEKGISEADLKTKMNAYRETQMKAGLQNLVSSGAITQAQADTKLAKMKTRMAEMAKNMQNKAKGMFGQNKSH